MRKLVVLVLLLLSFVPGYSQDLARVRGVLDTLCSPDYHGRGYVEGGDLKAARYIAQQFSEIDLEKLNNSFFQSFSFPINTFPGKLSLKVNNKSLMPGKDFILEASSPSAKFEGKICYFDTLIFTSDVAREKFLKQSCKNVVLVYSSADFPKIMKLEDKYRERFNCYKALIELQKNKLTASVSTAQSSKVTFQVLEASFPKSVKKVEFEVEANFIGDYKSQNVLGKIIGNKVADSLIVITAHYDHLGRMGKEVYFPGANDNASGISMLLELAGYYKNNPSAAKYSIVFIAFAGEEAGLLGSRFFVENPLIALSNIKFLINLDLVGTGDDGLAIVNATFHPKELVTVETLNTENHYFSFIKKRGEAANSDHYFFHTKGVKSFFIYTLGGIKAYHDIDDRPESLPLTKYKELYKLLIQFVERI